MDFDESNYSKLSREIVQTNVGTKKNDNKKNTSLGQIYQSYFLTVFYWCYWDCGESVTLSYRLCQRLVENP